jgi:hypothetical protein
LKTRTFRWTRKTGLTLLGLGLIVTLVCLLVVDLTTLDLLGNNPTARYGDMRLAVPRGSILEMLGTAIYDAFAVLLLAGAICGAYVGTCLAAVATASLANSGVAITIDSRGVLNWFWSDTLVPWSQVRRIDGVRWQPDGELSAGSYVTLVVDRPADYLDRARPIWRQRTPFFIKQLSIAYILLDDPVGFVGALLEHRPDPEKPPPSDTSARP